MAAQIPGDINPKYLSALTFDKKEHQEWAKNIVVELIRLRNVVDQLVTNYNLTAAEYNAHTHRYDPTRVAVATTSVPQTTAAVDTSVAASRITATTAPPTVAVTHK